VAGGQIAHLAGYKRPMQRIQMRKQDGNFGKERVVQNGGNLIFASAARVPDQLADIHLKRRSQPLKGTERGDGFAVFDL
jgi:hypothetical protein